jgi:hypothetical protein
LNLCDQTKTPGATNTMKTRAAAKMTADVTESGTVQYTAPTDRMSARRAWMMADTAWMHVREVSKAGGMKIAYLKAPSEKRVKRKELDSAENECKNGEVVREA